jgi:hypothetical protein
MEELMLWPAGATEFSILELGVMGALMGAKLPEQQPRAPPPVLWHFMRRS